MYCLAHSLAVAIAVSITFSPVDTASAVDWRSRSIYQLMTDRFARTDGSTTAKCVNGYEGYCGGTWKGIAQKLDYIKGMGFDAIWISPVTKQIDSPSGSRGYHGYSQQDLYQVNQNFGTEQDLKDLASALHEKEMYLMVDVVTNHFGYNGDVSTIDYSTLNPFKSSIDFHKFCEMQDTDNMTILTTCDLGTSSSPLPDVATTSPSVRAEFSKWIKQLISTYSVDGLRVDSVKNVEQEFWGQFQSAAGIYAVGEVSDGRTDHACPYQNNGLDGILNYPMYFQLTYFFNDSSTKSANLLNIMSDVRSKCKDSTLLAPFAENHDQARFGSYTKDMSLATNVIAFTMLADGIPIIYSGQEQHLSGGHDPFDREAIWLTGYQTTPLTKAITTLNAIRKLAISKASSYVNYAPEVITSTDHIFAIRKGDIGSQIVAVYNNLGQDENTPIFLPVTTGFGVGTEIMEVLTCKPSIVQSKTLTANVSGGMPLVFFPTAGLKGSGICGQ